MASWDVALLHGFGSSARHGWVDTGWTALLESAGRRPYATDLLGHGDAAKPHDPDAYRSLADLAPQVLEAGEPVDAIGFSAGAQVLIRMAAAEPGRFRRLALLGVGEHVLEAGDGPADPGAAGVIERLMSQPGNDGEALRAFATGALPPLEKTVLGRITATCLLVIGEQDLTGRGEPLRDALADAELVTVPRLDHFNTPRDRRVMRSVLRFMAA
jgi:pimeloyl-ACP methyl ester carboxylesterase